MQIANCRVRGLEGLYDVSYEDGKFTEICAHDEKNVEANAYQAEGRLLMPPFVEPHIHLDCVLTAGKPHYNMSGTLFEGISTWHEYKTTYPLVVDEIKERARIALRSMAKYGVQFVRTHVDVTEETFSGVEALEQLKEKMRGTMEIQTIAFPQNGILSIKDGKKNMERAMERGMDCVGGIPHYEFTREYGIESLKYIFELAKKYDACVDVHCDEMDDEQSRFLETLATLAWENDWGSRTVAAHTCAMGSYNDSYCTKLFRLLKESGIRINACPSANIHLQGRTDKFPKRRGVTRIKELSDAGINICLGQDSMSDPWYPIGVGNLLRVLEMGVHTAHMTGYEDLQHCLDLISINGAHNLCIEDQYGIEVGKPANFIILDGENDFEILKNLSPVLLSVHNGKTLVSAKPASVSVEF